MFQFGYTCSGLEGYAPRMAESFQVGSADPTDFELVYTQTTTGQKENKHSEESTGSLFRFAPILRNTSTALLSS